MSNSEHVFEGAPDGRQADDIRPSRFRPRYRALSPEEKALHDAIKAKAAELEELFGQAEALTEVTYGASAEAYRMPAHYFTDGLKSLELAVMWTVKGLTS